MKKFKLFLFFLVSVVKALDVTTSTTLNGNQVFDVPVTIAGTGSLTLNSGTNYIFYMNVSVDNPGSLNADFDYDSFIFRWWF